MPCPLEMYTYATPVVATSILILYNNVNISANAGFLKPKPPNMYHPRIGSDCNEEAWNIFLQKWTMFKDSTDMSEPEKLI